MFPPSPVVAAAGEGHCMVAPGSSWGKGKLIFHHNKKNAFLSHEGRLV
jgi:hypothetical protein